MHRRMISHDLIPSRPQTAAGRRGFTLVELMIVIVIIGILMALILPAIFGAMSRARDAEVSTEIDKLSAAIGQFKARTGMDPPSRITLYDTAAGWNGDARSRAFIRRIWPQFDFTGSGGLTLTTGTFPVELHGPECLVFFLGGPRDGTGALKGFSKNPAQPFLTTGSREGSSFEFDPARLVDLDTPPDGFPEYRDTLPSQSRPYLYLTSYDGRGYDQADLGPTANPTVFVGTMTDAYFQRGRTTAPLNPNGYQIISPGSNGEFGIGGALESEDANNNASLDTGEDTNGNGALDTDRASVLAGTREVERDNITNFTKGPLAP